jgi:hypothetical protein
LASQLATIAVPTTEDACRTCIRSTAPRETNYVIASLARGAIRQHRPEDVETMRGLEPMLHIGRPLSQASQAGPGSVLHTLFASLAINQRLDCDCESLLREMNRLGVDGCRRERPRLVAALKANAKKYSWVDTMRAARHVATSELALRIDVRDPIGWLFDEAVHLAELGRKS